MFWFAFSLIPAILHVIFSCICWKGQFFLLLVYLLFSLPWKIIDCSGITWLLEYCEIPRMILTAT